MKGATDKAIYRDAGGADEQLDKHSLSATAWGRQRHSVRPCRDNASRAAGGLPARFAGRPAQKTSVA
jgi:hypothetical protein